MRNTKVLNYEIIYDVIGYDVTSNIPRVNKIAVKSFYPDFGFLSWNTSFLNKMTFKYHFRSKFSVGYLIYTGKPRAIPHRASLNLVLESISSNRALTVSFLGLENVRQLIIIIGQFRQNQIIIFQRGDEVFMENHNL